MPRIEANNTGANNIYVPVCMYAYFTASRPIYKYTVLEHKLPVQNKTKTHRLFGFHKERQQFLGTVKP